MSDAKKISKAMRVPCAIAIVSAHLRKPPQPGRVGRARCTDVILVDAVRNGAAIAGSYGDRGEKMRSHPPDDLSGAGI